MSGAIIEYEKGVIEYRNNDERYRVWLREPNDGYVLVVRRPRPPKLPRGTQTLHQKECPSLAQQLTTNRKPCGTRQALTEWTRQQFGDDPKLCSKCM